MARDYSSDLHLGSDGKPTTIRRTLLVNIRLMSRKGMAHVYFAWFVTGGTATRRHLQNLNLS